MKKRFSFRFKQDVLLLIFFLLLSSLLLSFSGGVFIVNFKSVGFTVAAGTENAVHSVSSFITNVTSSVRELAELREKYAALTEKLKDYELLQRSNADIRRENRELRELLGFSEELNTIPIICIRELSSIGGQSTAYGKTCRCLHFRARTQV